MATVLILNKPTTSVGLTSFTYTAAASQVYYVSVQCSEVAPSALQVQVLQNASLIYTSPVLGPNTNVFQFKVPVNAAINDVIHVNLSSAAANDQQLNTVKTNVTVGDGY